MSSTGSPTRMPRDAAKTIRLPCACANLRRTSRVLSRLYDDALRPSGLNLAQFTLLQALTYAPNMSQKQLAHLLDIDSTTLTRTLALLRRKSWLSSQPGADRRELRLSLTPAGKREYERALPHWHNAQKRLQKALGRENLNRLIDLALVATDALAEH